jgi:endonuclease/exonuclease/phosphatase family metal-dependent hydrolase
MMRLLSWNVQWCRGMDGVVDPARIAGEARRLGDPDVLCFQEVAAGHAGLPGSRGEDQFELLSRAFPGYSAWPVITVESPGKRFGNLLLSRLPVRRVQRHSLPWPPLAGESSMPRAAVDAVVEAPFGELRALTTHLEYASDEHRAAQIGRLRALHAEACAERALEDEPGPYELTAPLPRAAVLCGDFNFAPGDPLHMRLKEAGFVDAWEHLHPAEPHPHTFRVHESPREKPALCCDYFFVSRELAPRIRSIHVDGENRASDHQPVTLELR